MIVTFDCNIRGSLHASETQRTRRFLSILDVNTRSVMEENNKQKAVLKSMSLRMKESVSWAYMGLQECSVIYNYDQCYSTCVCFRVGGFLHVTNICTSVLQHYIQEANMRAAMLGQEHESSQKHEQLMKYKHQFTLTRLSTKRRAMVYLLE